MFKTAKFQIRQRRFQPNLTKPNRVAFISAKSHKRQRRKRQSS